MHSVFEKVFCWFWRFKACRRPLTSIVFQQICNDFVMKSPFSIFIAILIKIIPKSIKNAFGNLINKNDTIFGGFLFAFDIQNGVKTGRYFHFWASGILLWTDLGPKLPQDGSQPLSWMPFKWYLVDLDPICFTFSALKSSKIRSYDSSLERLAWKRHGAAVHRRRRLR